MVKEIIVLSLCHRYFQHSLRKDQKEEALQMSSANKQIKIHKRVFNDSKSDNL